MSHVQIELVQAKSLLSKASGFMSEYDFTLNPYTGCAFGCTYCYAAFFASTRPLKDSWGEWVKVKENALTLLQKFRRRPLKGQTIYMSSVTDPYQPVEQKLELTRSILLELVRYHEVRLVIQTRSPLVTRDIELLQQFKTVRVNMTITTDSEAIRKTFEPTCPPNHQRLAAIKQINESKIETCITLTPLLPVADPQQFTQDLRATGVGRFVVQPFHANRGKFAGGTGQQARELSATWDWDNSKYRAVVEILRSGLPNLVEGKAGFSP